MSCNLPGRRPIGSYFLTAAASSRKALRRRFSAIRVKRGPRCSFQGLIEADGMDRFVNQFFNVTVWWRHWDELWRGFGLTIWLAVIIVLTGMAIGLALGLLRIAGFRPMQWGIIAFADAFRAFPPLMILVVIYFALPFAGVKLSGFVSAWIGLSLVLAAFV